MTRQGASQSTFNEWLRTQRALLEDWGRTLDGTSSAEARQMIEEMMRAWRKSVDETLEAQRAWARSFADEVGAMEGVPADVAAQIRKSADEFAAWADAQGEVWGEWFSIAREIVPDEARSAGQDVTRLAFAAMQQGFERISDANRRIVERMDEASKRAT